MQRSVCQPCWLNKTHLVFPLAEELFVQTCVKSAKGLNQKLEGVVTTGVGTKKA